MTNQEMIEQLTDPLATLEMQHKATMSNFRTWMAAHDQARELVEELARAQFDLGRRALEVGQTETERWFETVLPSR